MPLLGLAAVAALLVAAPLALGVDPLGKAVAQIAAEPQPPEDEVKLGKWIGYLKQEKVYLQKIGKALKIENKFKAQQYAVKLNQNNNRANNTVIGFGFNHCRIDSSKFL